MLIVSDRQLTSGNHTFPAGIPFEEDDGVAMDLIRRGVARKSEPPKIYYQTKVITPEVREVRPEVAAPFRNSVVLDAESSPVAPASDTVLPVADVQEQGTANSFGRRGRKGHRSR